MPTTVRRALRGLGGATPSLERSSRRAWTRAGRRLAVRSFRRARAAARRRRRRRGARDAKHAIRLVQEHGVRAIALDPLPLHCELARERIAEAGLSDEIDVVEGAHRGAAVRRRVVRTGSGAATCSCTSTSSAGCAECARVLRPGGAMLAYVTLATEKLEPREAALARRRACASREPRRATRIEAACGRGRARARVEDRLGCEWRERDDRGRRRGSRRTTCCSSRACAGASAELVERHGEATVDAARTRVGRVPAARQALSDRLRLGAACVTASRTRSST